MTTAPSPFGEKVSLRARAPMFRGAIFQMEADEKGLALVESKVNSLKVYVLVDPDSDKILETRFFTYGGPGFTAVADVICSRLREMSIQGATSITATDVELELRDHPEVPSLPENSPELVAISPLLEALVATYPEKKNVAFAAREAMSEQYIKANTAEGRAEADAEWNALPKDEKVDKVEKCFDEFIRAALNNDGGDIEILDLDERNKLKVRYQGACNSCSASSGGTLVFIENKVREHVYYALSVEPDYPSPF